MRTSHRPWIAGLGVIPLVLVLTGCFGLPSLPSIGGGVTGDGGTLTYTKDNLVVNVLMAKTGDGWTANYTVARTA